jgi:DnaJ-class molecular chaperone
MGARGGMGRGAGNGGFKTAGTHPFTGRRVTRRGSDAEHPIEVTLEEAFTGTQRQLQMQIEEHCAACHGSGLVNSRPCPTCGGSGVVGRIKTIEIKIPAGVHTGSRIRVRGEGGVGSPGQPKGDLFLVVTVLPHPRYERKGDDLQVNHPVALYTMVLGGETLVPTLKGTNLAITVPPTTQNGRIIRLKGQGMPKLGQTDQRGDLLVKVEAQLPKHLSDEEKGLFEDLRALHEGQEAR